MNANTVCFSGFSREDEAQVMSAFDQANTLLPLRWAATNEKEAELIVIDMDTVYGHMTWLKANNDGKMTAAVTTHDRAETNHLLPRPVTSQSLVQLLGQLSNQTPSVVPIVRTTGQHAAITSEMLTARASDPQASRMAPEIPSPRVTGTQAAVVAEAAFAGTRLSTGTQAAMPKLAPKALKLIDFLKPNILGGPVKIQLTDSPLLVIDLASQSYLGGNSLKPYMSYCTATLSESDFTAIDHQELDQLSKQLGGSQPILRLSWLAALLGGNGQLLPAYNPNSLFKLNKWPQTEREFPKHFRIATVMMRGPAKLTEISELSGSSLSDVTDFVNANLLSGHASV
jgi:hypothetical protein